MEDENGRFALTKLSALLTDGPESVRAMANHLCEDPS